MNKAELIEAIKAKGFVAVIVNEDAKNAELETLLEQLNVVKGISEDEHLDLLKSNQAELQANHDAAIESLVEAHNAALDSLKAEHEEAVKELSNSLDELNKALQSAESKPTTASVGNPIVTVGDKKYEVLTGGSVKVGEAYEIFSKEKLAESPEALAFLVKIESGLLKEVEE